MITNFNLLMSFKDFESKKDVSAVPKNNIVDENESHLNVEVTTEDNSKQLESTQIRPPKGPMFGGVSMFGNMGSDISAAINARNKKPNEATSVPKLPSASNQSDPRKDFVDTEEDKVIPKNKTPIASSLFDDDSDDEDDLFSLTNNKTTPINTNPVTNMKDNVAIDDNDKRNQIAPELPKVPKPRMAVPKDIESENEEETKAAVTTEETKEVTENNEAEKHKPRKPFGGVSMFGASSIGITDALKKPSKEKQIKKNNMPKKDLFYIVAA